MKREYFHHSVQSFFKRFGGTAEVMDAVAALGKSKYSGPRGTSGVPVNVLAALCGQDNLVRIETGDSPKDFVVTPIRLVRREIPLSAKSEQGRE